MGKKLSKAGAILRRDIRAAIDADPTIDHHELRSAYKVGEFTIDAALTKTVAEWDAIIRIGDKGGDAAPVASHDPTPIAQPRLARNNYENDATSQSAGVLGIERGFIKFTRKPAKMGTDFIFWIPRVYIKNGLVDPTCEYDVYLKRKA